MHTTPTIDAQYMLLFQLSSKYKKHFRALTTLVPPFQPHAPHRMFSIHGLNFQAS